MLRRRGPQRDQLRGERSRRDVERVGLHGLVREWRRHVERVERRGYRRLLHGSSASSSGSAGVTYAYAHTNTELYKFDPSQTTISMQLVGSFDCIGTYSGSSSSGGSSGGAPTTCAEVGGGSAGCCYNNTNYYCSSGSVKSTKCTSKEVCTWDASKSYYYCATGSTPTPAPGDNPPIACGGGSSSSSSSSSSSGGAQDTSMTDLAVDSQGNLWGVSDKYAYQLEIQGSTVHCAKTVSLQSVPATFYALSFVPKGIIDPNAETLLAGDTNGDLWRIDTTTGALEQHGSFGTVPPDDGRGHTYTNAGKAWELSGDIVFLDGTGTNPAVGFATVRDCPNPPSTSGCDTSDTLIQIDPTKLGALGTAVTGDVTLGLRGQIVKSASCTDTATAYGAMYGIAAWNSTIYGFSHNANVVEISNIDGSACAVSATNGSQSWSGAAVTTIAPVSNPPPPPVQ